MVPLFCTISRYLSNSFAVQSLDLLVRTTGESCKPGNLAIVPSVVDSSTIVVDRAQSVGHASSSTVRRSAASAIVACFRAARACRDFPDLLRFSSNSSLTVLSRSLPEF
ncbi:unnamed protein product [Acanthoscelides obtectus]|uniref:Uncharacterized protein n=1 Tax=Acanthoscelides obtectus TaxID=200917 RepID=A0A9P0KIR9_ACAOB|nr:unnamed protein product [Acanthoscelides obtectus]CAK1647176.1 hypothetical protein AOBTE_LOCUS15091 [Acanthoscelides obtectus]